MIRPKLGYALHETCFVQSVVLDGIRCPPARMQASTQEKESAGRINNTDCRRTRILLLDPVFLFCCIVLWCAQTLGLCCTIRVLLNIGSLESLEWLGTMQSNVRQWHTSKNSILSQSHVSSRRLPRKTLWWTKALHWWVTTFQQTLYIYIRALRFCYVLYKSMSGLVKSIDLINFGTEVFKCIYFIQ